MALQLHMVERRHGVAGNPHEQPRSRHAQHVSRGVPNAQETGAGQLEPAWARHLAQCVRCFADSHGCPPGARRRVVMRLPACTHCRRSTCAVGGSHQRCHARPTLRLLCRLHSRTHITDARALSFVQICLSELLYVELRLPAVRAFLVLHSVHGFAVILFIGLWSPPRCGNPPMRTNAYVVITALWITSFAQPTLDVIWFAHHHPPPPLSEPEPFSAFAAAATAVAVAATPGQSSPSPPTPSLSPPTVRP